MSARVEMASSGAMEHLEQIMQGNTLVKYPKKVSKRPEEYFVRVDMATSEILWGPLRKKKIKKRRVIT